MTRWIVVALFACGSPSKPPEVPTGEAGGVPSGTTCEAMRGKIEQLVRAGSREPDPARLAERVADNTTMVMNDCRKAPDQTTACIAAAASVQELEARCLVPLDDEGTEGDSVAR
jgi:hypothetical protein